MLLYKKKRKVKYNNIINLRKIQSKTHKEQEQSILYDVLATTQ